MTSWHTANAQSARAAAQGHQAALIDEMAKHGASSSDAGLYLLVDCGIAPSVLRFATRHLSTFAHTALLENTPEEHLAKRFSPWLVALPGELTEAWQGGERTTLLGDLCRLAQDHPAVSWLWSSNDLDALSGHLRRFMSGSLWNEPEQLDEGEVFLRYYDARVLCAYLSVLSPAQRNALLRPLAAWALWDRHLAWHTWAGIDAPVGEPEPAIFRYTLTQQERLAFAGQPDKVLHLIADGHARAGADSPLRRNLFDLPPDARYRRISTLVSEARELGLRSDADLMLYAVLALDIHPRFIDHPELQRRVMPALRASGDFSAALDGVPDAAWHDLARAQENHPSRFADELTASSV